MGKTATKASIPEEVEMAQEMKKAQMIATHTRLAMTTGSVRPEARWGKRQMAIALLMFGADVLPRARMQVKTSALPPRGFLIWKMLALEKAITFNAGKEMRAVMAPIGEDPKERWS